MKSINTKFPVVEHLRESFSVDCVNACGDPSADPSLRAACDLGSQLYCKTDNILSTECNEYLTRVFGTKAGITIPMPIAADTINTYYAELKAYVISVAKAIDDVPSLTSSRMNNLLAALQKESSKEMYYAVVDAVIAKWRAKAETGWTTLPWVIDRIKTYFATDLYANKEQTAVEILGYIQARWGVYFKFWQLSTGLFDLIMTKDVKSVLTNSTLLTLRELSPYFRNAIDSYVVSLSAKEGFDDIPLTSSGDYNINLSGSATIYNNIIRPFYLALKARPYASSDKLLARFEAADAANIARATTVNPNTDPVCIAMKATGEPTLVTVINNAIAIRCSSASNVSAPECVSYITTMNPISDATYKLILQGSVKSDGTLDSAVLNKYPGMKAWLLKHTADAVTVDTNGNAVISSTCTPKTNLTATQCNQLCKIYPETCNADQIKRCSIGGYRYKNTFANKEGLELVPDTDSDIYWWILFILILLAFVFLLNRRHIAPETLRGWAVKGSINAFDDGISL